MGSSVVDSLSHFFREHSRELQDFRMHANNTTNPIIKKMKIYHLRMLGIAQSTTSIFLSDTPQSQYTVKQVLVFIHTTEAQDPHPSGACPPGGQGLQSVCSP